MKRIIRICYPGAPHVSRDILEKLTQDQLVSAVESVLEAFPHLTLHAWTESYNGMESEEEFKNTVEIQRQNCLHPSALQQIYFAMQWLGDIDRGTCFNSNCYSYQLKHRVEESVYPKFYVANGAFIIAAILMGFNAKSAAKAEGCAGATSRNAIFDMSYRDVSAKSRWGYRTAYTLPMKQG